MYYYYRLLLARLHIM